MKLRGRRGLGLVVLMVQYLWMILRASSDQTQYVCPLLDVGDCINIDVNN